MGAAASMGVAVKRWQHAGRIAVAAALFSAALTASAAAADRYALIVTGATAGPQYAFKYDGWRVSLTTLFRTQFGFPRDHVVVLAEEPSDSEGPDVRKATRENVRAALSALAQRAGDDDIVFVMVAGHGATGDDDQAKFNLVGRDLSADEWAGLVKPIRGRIVFVNGASASFPFLQKLAGLRRIVITATATPTQLYETVFPEYFIGAFHEVAADATRTDACPSGKRSSSRRTACGSGFADRGQLPTERPLLDDTGDGIGREATDVSGASQDGEIAKITFLRNEAPVDTRPEMSVLVTRRAALAAEVEALRTRQASMPRSEYQSRLEALLLQIAQLDRELREAR
jgi:hypothetical protein